MNDRPTQADLKKAVIAALEVMFENCDVTPDEMRDDLNSIKDEIDGMIESLNDEAA